MFLVGVVAAGRVARSVGAEDPGLVVVDEVVGQWITLLALPFTPAVALAGFVLFRVMDVVKPWPAREPRAAARRLGDHGRRRDGGYLRTPGAARRPARLAGGAVKAELLAVGSELLGPLRAETNTLWLTERLLDAGIEVAARATLADDLALVAVRVPRGAGARRRRDRDRRARPDRGRPDARGGGGGDGPRLRRDSRRSSSALRERFARYGRKLTPHATRSRPT